jgi:nitrite reductase/ring-hydroxylating ferredoxin subunit
MELYNAEPESQTEPALSERIIVVGRIEDLPAGRCATVELSHGEEVAVYNVAGEFFATDNSCPHHGAPLAEGRLCGHIIECGFHGWRFDVRNGKCLTVTESIRTYRVVVEEGMIKIAMSEPPA